MSHNPNTKAALAAFVAEVGPKLPKDLDASTVNLIIRHWREFSQHTRATYAKIARKFFLWLEQACGAPVGIHHAIPKTQQPPPRLTVATDTERELLLRHASPSLRFFILLCADLGLRHRTAAAIALRNYDPHTRSLTFMTKGNVQQSLPITPAIAAAIEALPPDADPDQPMVSLIHTGRAHGSRPRFTKAWIRLKAKLGIREDLHIHDLRRTVAEDVYEATKDVRFVQAQLGHRSITTTARYLANRLNMRDLAPIVDKVLALREQRLAATLEDARARAAESEST